MIDDKMIKEAKEKAVVTVRFKKTILIVAAVILMLTLSIPALAAASNIEPVYNVLYAISPEMAQLLKPIRISSESNGIVMEVVSADIHDSEALICVSMKDIKSNRIDETTDLFDSYRINMDFDSSAYCQRIDFDEDTKTATFLIVINRLDGKEIQKEKITFSVKEFLSNKNKAELDITQKVLSLCKENPETQTGIWFRGVSSKEIAKNIEYYQNLNWLLPQVDECFSVLSGVKITGVGYIDGKLHIQTYYENIKQTDNHGSIKLLDKNDNVHYGMGVSFYDSDKKGSYDETIFDVAIDELKNYKVIGEFVTADPAIKGNWQVTFKL